MSTDFIEPANRGYTKRLHTDPKAPRGCVCPEEFEHDGKCQNALSGPKNAKCKPCSAGWHFDGACGQKFQLKPFGNPSTQCDRCGWDLADHPLTERERALIWQRRS